MIGTVKIEGIHKTYIAKQRKGLFKAEKRPVEALKNMDLENVYLSPAARALLEADPDSAPAP